MAVIPDGGQEFWSVTTGGFMIVDEFLRWVQTAPAQARVDATRALANSYLYSEMEQVVRDAAEAAMTILLDDPSIAVRRTLADVLATSPGAPRHLIRELAQDQPDVAEPVLRRSPFLLDSELIDIAALGDHHAHRAIAGRSQVSASVAAALAEIAGPETLAILVRNPRARLAGVTLHRLVERHGADPELRDTLLARPDLPLDVRHRLIAKLGEALSDLAVVRAWMPARRAETVTRDACDKAAVTISIEAESEDVDALVDHLRRSGQLTTSLILRSICLGELRFFEAALSALSGMPRKRIFALLERGNESAFRALYDKARLPASAFPAFRAALRLLREMQYDGDVADRYRFARRMIERMLTRTDDIGDAELDRLLAMLRRFAADAARCSARDYAEKVTAAA
ncbi:MAG: DUF2336 domain-containing protein [Hyphomicrobiales bacterium]|nr:DUF2336 domain-containing protein [Hyphomicrobiales bacterium]